MLIYLMRRVAVGFFASYDHVCGWVLLLVWWSCEVAAKSSHCGKGGWTRLFAFAYTREVSRGTERLRAGQFEQQRNDIYEIAAD